jgi:alpha-mannosidase
MAGKAYSWFHNSRVGTLTRDSDPQPFFAYLDELVEQDYPYDMVQIRYSIGGDNGPPDQELSEFVKKWNEKYVWPRMIIATTSQLMHTLEERYGRQLPEVRGDFTPYWEDGAASSARETALTRMSSERLVQAEALYGILARDQYPVEQFESAWRDVLLYNEHTWGAHCSISQPDSPFTHSQWKIKQSFAVNADQKSRALLERVVGGDGQVDRAPIEAIDVYNTNSWPRTDLVMLQTDPPMAGQVVKDRGGKVIPSELTPGGQLVFLAADVPPLGGKRFFVTPGTPSRAGRAVADGNVLSNGRVEVEVNPKTGAIASVRWSDDRVELVDRASSRGWNEYCYVAGRVADDPGTSRVSRIETISSAGLTASLIVYSEAPGCKQLMTVVRVIDGLDRIDIVNALNKEKVLRKESVHFGFPFRVPDGTMRIDIPWAVIRPELDQLPGACKNYLTAGRWVDVSNDEFGVTWSTSDAPLVEVGGIHVDVEDPFFSGNWIQHLEPTQTLYSYVMNNYWETNYRASQEGVTTFRYSILPHKEFDQGAATRFGIEQSQPLIAVPARTNAAVPGSRLRVDNKDVLVTSFKPSDDATALIVRLFNAGTEPATASLDWSDPVPQRVTLSSPREEHGSNIKGSIELPPLGIATLRAEFGAP